MTRHYWRINISQHLTNRNTNKVLYEIIAYSRTGLIQIWWHCEDVRIIWRWLFSPHFIYTTEEDHVLVFQHALSHDTDYNSPQGEYEMLICGILSQHAGDRPRPPSLCTNTELEIGTEIYSQFSYLHGSECLPHVSVWVTQAQNCEPSPDTRWPADVHRPKECHIAIWVAG